MGDKIKAAIAKVTNKPITLIINTHAHADHFGANEALAKGGASIVAHENLRERMAKGRYLAAFNQTIPPSPTRASRQAPRPSRHLATCWSRSARGCNN